MLVLACASVSILYQRGIYEPESFTKVQKYGLGLQVTTDQGLADYLKRVLTQLQGESTIACTCAAAFMRCELLRLLNSAALLCVCCPFSFDQSGLSAVR